MSNKFNWIFAALLLMLSSLSGANEIDPALANDECLACHDGEKSLETPSANAELESLQAVEPEGYSESVHAELNCIDCHTEISDARADHRKRDDSEVQDCVSCHRQLLAETEAEGTPPGRLKTVIENAEAHQRSFHAGEREDQPGTVRAGCEDCHSSHSFAVPAEKEGDEYDTWRLSIPELCGDCHEEEKEEFLGSVHGINLQEYENAEAAVCSDCHTTHEIGQADLDSFKLLLPDECGGCHAINLRTYRDTYHGQVNALGYTNTAKCYDCHGGHDITEVADSESKVHPDNRLETCRTCHDGEQAALATPGFVSYDPHAHAGDFERYPEVWFASNFMLALLVGVFLFFWTHSILWYYREWRSRDKMAPTTRVNTDDLDDWLGHQIADGSLDDKRHFLRFGVGWRWAHLAFALVTMTLVLTGTSLLYAGSDWAPVVINALGGAETAGLIHRVAALLFIGIFFTHFVIVMIKLLRTPDFRWFGPDSLVPRWQDFIDCWKMFRWFFGKGEKPLFDRWAYYEKFDYWAVFWGVNVIGASGIMLAFPDFTASFLPGWVFNVAAIVHGEEAFLAAVFLFTVHFFNNHFRPDKIPPPDIVMFSGTQSLDEFRRDHTKQYRRLKESGELENYLVEAPSAAMTTGFKLLGLTLIAIGLTLLALVINGYLFY